MTSKLEDKGRSGIELTDETTGDRLSTVEAVQGDGFTLKLTDWGRPFNFTRQQARWLYEYLRLVLDPPARPTFEQMAGRAVRCRCLHTEGGSRAVNAACPVHGIDRPGQGGAT